MGLRVTALLAMGLITTLMAPSTGRAQPTADVEMDWGAISTITTGTPIFHSPGTYYYDTYAPFAITWDPGYSPYPVPYYFWTNDSWFDETGTVDGWQPGARSLIIPTRMNNSITFNAELYDPVTGDIIASDSKTEAIEELTTSWNNYFDAVPFQDTVVKDHVRQVGDAVVEGTFDALFTPTRIQNYALQYNRTTQEVENMINNAEPQVAAAFHPVWEGWVSPVLATGSPTYAIRVASSHPLKGTAQDGLNAIPLGISSGVNDLLQPGETFIDIMPQVVDLQVNSSVVSDIALDGIDELFQTGQLPDIGALAGDRVILTKAGLIIPVTLTSQQWAISGSLKGGIQNASFEHIEGLYIGGQLDAHYTKSWHNMDLGVGFYKAEGQPTTGTLSIIVE